MQLCAVSRAHDGLELLPPTSVAEAWNVLMLCQANIEKLVAETQIKEIPAQMVLSIQAIRFLQKSVSNESLSGPLPASLAELSASADRVGGDSSGSDLPAALGSASNYRAMLKKTAALYPAPIVHSQIFNCPMCKGIRESNPNAPCPKCGMKLALRAIPSTAAPPEPSIVITPTAPLILSRNKKCEVALSFTWKRDGKPVAGDDLLVVHTEPIHLLIIDESLSDYHHEHPRQTGAPGEYAFAFTPRRAGSYRIFADVTSRESGAQEYPVCDLAGSAEGSALSDRSEISSGEDAGLHYELEWLTEGRPVHVHQPVHAVVKVTDAEGVPFQELEPIMGAYAHIVGFYEDRKTVVHIHPLGAEPTRADDRGGPSFTFQFIAPKPGYIRLYSQVQIGGVSRFVPFAITVVK